MFAATRIGHRESMETDELTRTRIAKNQVTFREANERIERAAGTIGLDGVIPFICECADAGCTQIVPIALDAYTDIRRSPRRFLNAPGHEALAVGSGAAVVVAHEDGYVVVDKIGIAGEIAEEAAG